MVYKPPVLSLTDLQERDVSLLSAVDRQAAILRLILEGQDMLTVAQALQLTEKEVSQSLTEALEVRTAFYKDSAQQYQTIILARLEEAYRDARGFAYRTVVDELSPEGRIEPDIHWFREMLKVLSEIQKLLAGHADNNNRPSLTYINQTILLGDDLYEKGRSMSEWKDKNIQDLIEGQIINE
jgi:hypothetical protein